VLRQICILHGTVLQTSHPFSQRTGLYIDLFSVFRAFSTRAASSKVWCAAAATTAAATTTAAGTNLWPVVVFWCTYSHRLNVSILVHKIPVVPHKAVAEVSKIGNLKERLVVVNHEWQSESSDGPTGGWSCVFPQLLDVVWCGAAEL